MSDYTIAELAAAAGMSQRNVRAYRDRGILDAPRRKGRHAIYSDHHLARLRLIGELLERGYTIGNISELLEAWAQGQEIGDLLGLSPLTTLGGETPGHVTIVELAAALGTALTPSGLQKAERLGVLVPDGDGYRVRSPKLLTAGAEIVAAGVPLEAVLDQLERLQKDIDNVAREFVGLITEHLVDPLGDVPSADKLEQLGSMVDRLLPLAEAVVDAELAVALERHVQQQVTERMDKIATLLGLR